MNRFIRTALMLALGLGVNLLCTDAWADEGPAAAAERSDASGKVTPGAEIPVEPIWSLPGDPG